MDAIATELSPSQAAPAEVAASPHQGHVTLPADPAERFRHVATRRTGEVLATIRKLGNVASKDYEYSDVQVKKIVKAIRGATDVLETKLTMRQPHVEVPLDL